MEKKIEVNSLGKQNKDIKGIWINIYVGIILCLSNFR